MGRTAISDKPLVIERRLITPTRSKLHPVKTPLPDLRELHLAFTRRCENIASLLAASDHDERLAIYSSGYVSPHELSIAAALRPDLMPVLNGEWEWIALTMADLD